MAPAIAITAPTDRSMPRVAITSTMPSDSSATGVPRLSTSIRLPNSRPSCRRRSKNCGETARSTARMTMRAKIWARPRRGRRGIMAGPLACAQHRRRPEVQQPDETHGDLVLLAARQRPVQPPPCLQRQHDVLAYGEIGDDSFGLAILGAIAEAQSRGVARRVEPNQFALHPGLPGIGAFGAEHQSRRLRAARAEQPGEADDFATAQLQIKRREITGLAVA